MIDQYVLYINDLETNNVMFGKSSKHEEDALNFIYEKATEIVKTYNGEKHLDLISQITNFDDIQCNNKYPSGLYIKKYKHHIEIYEKTIKEPTFVFNITKSVVCDYKFINKPSIKNIIESDKFPTSNLYGFVVSKQDTKYKLLIKDTFKGTIYNYDDVKILYEFICDGFHMSKPDQLVHYNNNDTIYYINHDEESFIVELVKGIINVKQIEQQVDFKIVNIIGYNKITVDLPYISNNNITNKNKSNNNNNKTNQSILAKQQKSDYGAVSSQLCDIFKKYDIDSCTEQFKPSMFKKKKKEELPSKVVEKIVEKIVEKNVVDLIELSAIRIGTLTKLYFEYINDIEDNMMDSQVSIKKYATSLNDILDLNLSELINVYKITSERLSKIIKEKNIIITDTNNNEPIIEDIPDKKKIIKKKFKKPTKILNNKLNHKNNIIIDTNLINNNELLNIYKNNKHIFDIFLIENKYNISPLDNIADMNQMDINYWSRVFNFALKNIDVQHITIQDVSNLYTKYKTRFDEYFKENNIRLTDNFQDLLEWGEIQYEDICYLLSIFTKALKHVDIVNNKIDVKDITGI